MTSRNAWDHLPTCDQEQALDVAVYALSRHARILEGQDPGAAKALRTMATEIEARFSRQDGRRAG